MEHTSAKDLVGVIRKSPSLMITFGVVFVFLLIYLYEKGKSGTASTTTATQPAQFAPATGSYVFEEDIHPTAAPTIPVGPPTVVPLPAPPTPILQPTPGPVPQQPAPKKPALPVSPVVKPKPVPTASAKYYTVTKWPAPGSSLWTISQITHVPLATIERLNPQIKNPNLIYPNQKVRYA